MGYECDILADSISDQGIRLTTFCVQFPRFILSELNTHRMLSRNSASSRAIPTEKIIDQIIDDPFIPEFNKRVTGMGVGEILDKDEQNTAKSVWLDARRAMVLRASGLIHTDKSRVNRLLEPFAWHTAIITATDWGNFFKLRTASDAQPEFKIIADMMKAIYKVSQPKKLKQYCYHLPLLTEDELTSINSEQDREYWRKVSVGRCARVSYLTHDGKRDPEADIALYDRLQKSGHMSPFEHVARPFTENEWDYVKDIGSEYHVDPHNEEYDGFVDYKSKQVEYVGNLHGWVSERMSIECHI